MLRRMSFIIISDSAGVSFRDTDSFLSAGVDYNNISVHGAECDSGLQFGGHHTLARYALFLGTTCINPSSSTVDYRDSRHQHQTSQTWRLFCVPLVMFWRIRDTILFALRFKHHIQFFLLSTNKLINSPPLDPHPRHPLSISSTSSSYAELLCRCCAEIILINLLIFPGREYSEFFAQSSVTPISLTCAYLNVRLVFSGCLGMFSIHPWNNEKNRMLPIILMGWINFWQISAPTYVYHINILECVLCLSWKKLSPITSKRSNCNWCPLM